MITELAPSPEAYAETELTDDESPAVTAEEEMDADDPENQEAKAAPENGLETAADLLAEFEPVITSSITNQFRLENGEWLTDLTTDEGEEIKDVRLLEHDPELLERVLNLEPGESISTSSEGINRDGEAVIFTTGYVREADAIVVTHIESLPPAVDEEEDADEAADQMPDGEVAEADYEDGDPIHDDDGSDRFATVAPPAVNVAVPIPLEPGVPASVRTEVLAPAVPESKTGTVDAQPPSPSLPVNAAPKPAVPGGSPDQPAGGGHLTPTVEVKPPVAVAEARPVALATETEAAPSSTKPLEAPAPNAEAAPTVSPAQPRQNTPHEVRPAAPTTASAEAAVAPAPAEAAPMPVKQNAIIHQPSAPSEAVQSPVRIEDSPGRDGATNELEQAAPAVPGPIDAVPVAKPVEMAAPDSASRSEPIAQNLPKQAETSVTPQRTASVEAAPLVAAPDQEVALVSETAPPPAVGVVKVTHTQTSRPSEVQFHDATAAEVISAPVVQAETPVQVTEQLMPHFEAVVPADAAVAAAAETAAIAPDPEAPIYDEKIPAEVLETTGLIQEKTESIAAPAETLAAAPDPILRATQQTVTHEIATSEEEIAAAPVAESIAEPAQMSAPSLEPAQPAPVDSVAAQTVALASPAETGKFVEPTGPAATVESTIMLDEMPVTHDEAAPSLEFVDAPPTIQSELPIQEVAPAPLEIFLPETPVIISPAESSPAQREVPAGVAIDSAAAPVDVTLPRQVPAVRPTIPASRATWQEDFGAAPPAEVDDEWRAGLPAVRPAEAETASRAQPVYVQTSAGDDDVEDLVIAFSAGPANTHKRPVRRARTAAA